MSLEENNLTPVDETTEVPAEKKRKNRRKLKMGATATAITVVVIAAVVLLNVVVGILDTRYPLNWDITEDGDYTLCDESRALATRIKDNKAVSEIQLTVFTPEDVFSDPSTGYDELNTILRQFSLFTKEYENLSGGKVKTTYIDLDSHPEKATAYAKYDVTGGSILVQNGDRFRTFAYGDLFTYDTDDYTGSYIFTSQVEQKLATAISSVCGGKSITVTFLTGHGEDNTAIALLQDLYQDNGYTTETLDFTATAPISDNTEALVIVAPIADYTENEISRLREFLNNGGARSKNLFVYCNCQGECPNLYEFLEADYGITVTSDLVVETDMSNISMYYAAPYYPLTDGITTDLTPEMGNKRLMMPLTLALKLAHGSDVKEESLSNTALVTFPESAQLIRMEDLISSAESEEAPEQRDAESYPIVGAAYAYEYSFNDNNEQLNTYVTVYGSYGLCSFVTEGNYGNKELLLQPVTTLCDLGETVVIPSRDVEIKTTAFDSATAYVLGLGVFTIGLPLALIILSLVIFLRRRHL